MHSSLLQTLRKLPIDIGPHQKMAVRIDGTVYADPLPSVFRPVVQYFLGGHSRYDLVVRMSTLLDQILAFQNDLFIHVVPRREHYIRTHHMLSSTDRYLFNLQFVLDHLPRLHFLLRRLQSSYQQYPQLLSTLQDIETQVQTIHTALRLIQLSFRREIYPQNENGARDTAES